jgi:hypothetical protein
VVCSAGEAGGSAVAGSSGIKPSLGAGQGGAGSKRAEGPRWASSSHVTALGRPLATKCAHCRPSGAKGVCLAACTGALPRAGLVGARATARAHCCTNNAHVGASSTQRAGGCPRAAAVLSHLAVLAGACRGAPIVWIEFSQRASCAVGGPTATVVSAGTALAGPNGGAPRIGVISARQARRAGLGATVTPCSRCTDCAGSRPRATEFACCAGGAGGVGSAARIGVELSRVTRSARSSANCATPKPRRAVCAGGCPLRAELACCTAQAGCDGGAASRRVKLALGAWYCFVCTQGAVITPRAWFTVNGAWGTPGARRAAHTRTNAAVLSPSANCAGAGSNASDLVVEPANRAPCAEGGGACTICARAAGKAFINGCTRLGNSILACDAARAGG